jgi:peptidyl-prolyl cis-trans isomerase C
MSVRLIATAVVCSVVAAGPALADTPAADSAGPPPAAASPAAQATPGTQAEMQAAFLGTLQKLSAFLAKSPRVIVAEVGGQPITRGDVAEALGTLPPSNGERTLDSAYQAALQGLITQRALVIRAREAGIDNDPPVRQRIAASADTILGNEYLRRTTAPGVTDQMVHDAYDARVAKQAGPVAVRARIIAVGSEQEAAHVKAALDSGTDFAAAASTFSKDATASRGGDLGYVRPGTVLPEIGGVIFALGPGQVSAYPIRSGDALYFVKVEDRKEMPPPPYEAVRSTLTQQLMRAAVPNALQQAKDGLAVKEYGIGGKPSSGP